MKNEELDQILEKSFRTELDFQLQVDFAHKLTSVVQRREQWKTDLREYLFLAAVSLSLLLVASGIYYFIDKATILKAYSFISTHALPAILFVFTLNFIFLADRVLLRLLFSRWKRT